MGLRADIQIGGSQGFLDRLNELMVWYRVPRMRCRWSVNRRHLIEFNEVSAATPLKIAKLHPIVPHPARCTTNPAHSGPMSVPIANELLNSPNPCAAPPRLPKLPGRRFSSSSTTWSISAISGAMPIVKHNPMIERRAQSRTFRVRVSRVTKRRDIQKGMVAAKPTVVTIRPPWRSAIYPKMGAKRLGMTRQMNIRPAPLDVQWNVFFT